MSAIEIDDAEKDSTAHEKSVQEENIKLWIDICHTKTESFGLSEKHDLMIKKIRENKERGDCTRQVVYKKISSKELVFGDNNWQDLGRIPHSGYRIYRQWEKKKPTGYYKVTSDESVWFYRRGIGGDK